MKTTKKWSGALIIAAVLGLLLTLAACGTDYVQETGNRTITLSGGKNWVLKGINADKTHSYYKGTYTLSGENFTATVTHRNASDFPGETHWVATSGTLKGTLKDGKLTIPSYGVFTEKSAVSDAPLFEGEIDVIYE
jgi:hypothetical protein